MLAPNTILHKRYRIIQELGKGGMGAVYQAMDENLSCLVAVKETFGTTPDQQNAFEREAKLLANLSHPALPRVMHHFAEGDGQFLVMQFIPGNDLAELLTLRERPFAPAKVLEWAGHLLDALEELHSYKPPIIHRDIKPSNLKLTPRGRIMLLDFGIAKGAAGQMTTVETDGSLGAYTPNYAPLEQAVRSDRRWVDVLTITNAPAVDEILKKGTDARSDLYALGATMYHLITGEVPADAPTRALLVWSGKEDRLRAANIVNPDVSPQVAVVLQQAMAIDRNQRPVSAAAMREMLVEAAKAGASEWTEDRAKQSVVAQPQPDAEENAAAEARRVEEAEAHRREAEGRQKREEEETRQRQFAKEEARRVAVAVEVARKPAKSGEPLAAEIGPVPTAATVRSLEPAAIQSEKPKPRAHSPAGRRILKGVLVLTALALVGMILAVAAYVYWKSLQNETARQPIKPLLGAMMRSQMVYLPERSVVIGSENGAYDEKPAHWVSITKGFYIGKYEVTRAQWFAVMGYPSSFQGDNNPLTLVSWEFAQQFLSVLNGENDGYTYRLPTEAEWEYACRAGTIGDYVGTIDDLAWHSGNSSARAHPVGQKQRNAFGLYDMHGNVWEWCQDWYLNQYYSNSPNNDPRGPVSGQSRVIRGGSYATGTTQMRSSYRDPADPKYGRPDLGFRIVAVPRTQ